MALPVSVDVRLDTFTQRIPIPEFGERTIGPWTFGGQDLGPIQVGGFNVDLPAVDIPSITTTIPTVTPRSRRVDLGTIGPFPFPEFNTPRLVVEWSVISIPFTGERVVVLTDIDLVGGGIDIGLIGPFDLGTITVPGVSVGSDFVTIGGDTISLPSVTVPGFTLNLPDVPGFQVGPITVPTVGRDTIEVTLSDISTLRITAEVDETAVAGVLSKLVPSGFLSDAAGWTFGSVVSQLLERPVSELTHLGTLVLERILDEALSDETKQQLRETAERFD